jgi:hypothetical protein
MKEWEDNRAEGKGIRTGAWWMRGLAPDSIRPTTKSPKKQGKKNKEKYPGEA